MNKVNTEILNSAVETLGKSKLTVKELLTVTKEHGWSRQQTYNRIKNLPKVGLRNGQAIFELAMDTAPTVVGPVATAPVAPVELHNVRSVTNNEVYVPAKDATFVAWGHFADILRIINSGMFYPTYVSGLSGNGKTFMVEQACAKAGREYVRIQISPETDEDDLMGGFRLVNGETVFQKGPVIKAMEAGAILLIDEIDRGTNKVMCLQGVLEGKPVLVKKTGEVVSPKSGFNVIATANTKGKGDVDGRFSAATIIDEAFLERFVINVEQTYPTAITEKKIVMKHMKKFEAIDEEFSDLLVGWADAIRKTFYDDGVDDVISTRRLCHIVQTFSIFNKRDKAVALCVNRFDEDTKASFIDLYEKVDATINNPEPEVSDEVLEKAEEALREGMKDDWENDEEWNA